MFEELPCRVSRPIRFHGAKIDWKPGEGIVEVQMRVCSDE